MSTRSEHRVFVEFPDFGFGPAATMLALLAEAPAGIDWHIVTTGSAADFARQELPQATHHDLDTFDVACWPRFLDIAPPGSLVVSNTNPEFAAWAVDHGHEVGVVDTLDWMWPTIPRALDKARFHLVQAFFGHRATGRQTSGGAEVVAPIVDWTLWSPPPPEARPGSAVVGFGGMHLPGHQDLVGAYVHWLLAAVLPVLVDETGLAEVTVVGGRRDLVDLVPPAWRHHEAVRVRPAATRAEHAALCRSARHLLLSPGLTGIHECAASGLAPFLHPGFSMSMAFQSLRVAAIRYPYACAWPWLGEAAERLAGLPEQDGVTRVAAHIRASLDAGPASASFLTHGLRRYLTRDLHTPALEVRPAGEYPRAGQRLAHHLQRWQECTS